MYKKMCDRCCRPSYSASKFGKWTCPVCQKDLSNLKVMEAEEIASTGYVIANNNLKEIINPQIEKYI
ncbi:hypothetical protein V7138_06025 [Bacillus sp. JJ1533]|uniref:hypothetical protein n=1 Tax=Bacillus sp. JJ1533 TaxID=3122959 RepID=UPI002FFF0670